MCTVAELLDLLTHQLHINDVDSARLWTVEIDGLPYRRLLDNDLLTLDDLKIKQSAQVLRFYKIFIQKHFLSRRHFLDGSFFSFPFIVFNRFSYIGYYLVASGTAQC